MADPLRGKRVAILATNGSGQPELEDNYTEWGKTVPVDVELERTDPSRHATLVLPGGVMNPMRCAPLEAPST